MKRSLALITAVLLLLTLFAGCSAGEDKPAQQSTAATAAETTAETEMLRENTPDNLPDGLDYKGAVAKIALRDTKDATREFFSEETGEVTDDALYERNLLVEERLNVKLEPSVVVTDPTQMMNQVKTAILAATGDYDIVAGVQWRSLPLALEGCYVNLKDVKYIDLEQPWWWNEYIDELKVGPNAFFFLNGDISIVSIKQMSAMFFNKRLLDDIGMKHDELYDIVLEGKWDYDKLVELSNKAYKDVNGDGKHDENDVHGMMFRTGTEPDHFTYTSGNRMYTRDANGYPKLNVATEYFINYMNKLLDVYYNQPGSFVTADETLMVTKFTEGTSLFLVNRLISANYLREMEDEYGIVPFPKYLDTQEEYQALVHDSTCIYSVPIDAKDLDMTYALLEAMSAQNYRTVIPAFYETALKVKYQSDSTAGLVIDIIKSNAHTDFVYAYNYALNGAGLICRKMIAANSTDFASYWAAAQPGAETGLADLIKAFDSTVKK